MRKDLKSAINQTKDVEGQIRAALQTPQKRNKLWIITESDYDCGVYERFFNDNVVVKPAFDENGDGGCARVVRIVRNILDSGETQRIIGIRDADYMYYVPGKFRYSDNIYHTDERDIEMMMLKAPSVIYALNAWNALFPAKIVQVIPIACYMGLIRIWHVARDIHASMKKFHIACAWDLNAKPQKPVNHWKKVLRERYNRVTGEHLNDRMVNYIRNCYRLNDNQYGKICRGHDFVQLLGMAMVNANFSSKYVQLKIAESYDAADFARTTLAGNIRAFARRFGMVVM